MGWSILQSTEHIQLVLRKMLQNKRKTKPAKIFLPRIFWVIAEANFLSIWRERGKEKAILYPYICVYIYMHIYTFAYIYMQICKMPRMTMNSWLLIHTSRVGILSFSLFLSEVMNHGSEFSIFQISKAEICDKYDGLAGRGACTQT